MTTVGVTIGLLCGSGAVALLHWALSPEQVNAWGWRLPFLGSVVVAGIGLALRRRMPESDAFEGTAAPQPSMLQVLREHWLLMLRVVGTVVGANAVFYAGFVYMPDAISQAHPELADRAQGLNSALLAAQVVMVIAGGWISDRIGRWRACVLFNLLALALVVPAWRAFERGSLEGLLLAQAMLSLPVGALFGMQGAMVAEMCPPRARCMVYGLAYGLAVAAFAGTVPAMATWMVGERHWNDGPLIYMAVTVMVAVVALLSMPRGQLNRMDQAAGSAS